ncbi:MAG: glycoside hydrolase family 15 protein [Candidatus Aenigmarchaeota archaeon]|nr:glycoside hydrolase family 15 protein [Candidatus Aenigmarchaeota archaeon]
MYKSLSKYGIIGNCRSCGLVSDEGSIDWSCLPDFDSPSQLCAILDDEKGGFFKIVPVGFYKSSQKYINETNILETLFFNQNDSLSLVDFMPLSKEQEEKNNIPESGIKFVRQLRAIKGDHKIQLTLKLTPDFCREEIKLDKKDRKIIARHRDNIFVLYADMEDINITEDTITAEFILKQGQEKSIGFGFYKIAERSEAINMTESLNKNQEAIQLETRSDSAINTTIAINEFTEKDARRLYAETYNFWQWWASLCTYEGPFYNEVIRSALVLKLMIFAPTGAIIAAPTTSLPEKIGSGFNWDYRYTWIRDSSFMIYALIGLGYLKEADEFMHWIEKVYTKNNSLNNLQIVYDIHGEEKLTEYELNHLKGYMNSKPVRIGNAAHGQKQLDIFGEILSAINIYTESGGRLSEKMKLFIKQFVDYCCNHWTDKDSGIWEGRGEEKHYVYSKLMCWVGIDRGIKIAQRLGIDTDIEKWNAEKERIKNDILEKGYDNETDSFMAYYGSDSLDTSVLNISILGMLPANDEKMASTVENIMKKLVIDWFVLRTNDRTNKLQEGEGAFFLPVFWLIDNLAIMGRTKEARIWIDNIVRHATPLGLYAEEFEPHFKEHIGNFPQAFSHLGLINSVLTLRQAEMFGPEKAATTPAERLAKVIVSVFSRNGIANIGARRTIKDLLEKFLPYAIKSRIIRDIKRRTRKSTRDEILSFEF